MKVGITCFILAISLALTLPAERAYACPSKLKCSNFTQMDKRADCQFVMSQSLTQIEKQQVICGLWDESYEYETYQGYAYQQIEASLELEAEPISNSRFILAGKITVFLILNYVIFSLTKSVYFRKCLPAPLQT